MTSCHKNWAAKGAAATPQILESSIFLLIAREDNPWNHNMQPYMLEIKVAKVTTIITNWKEKKSQPFLTKRGQSYWRTFNWLWSYYLFLRDHVFRFIDNNDKIDGLMITRQHKISDSSSFFLLLLSIFGRDFIPRGYTDHCSDESTSSTPWGILQRKFCHKVAWKSKSRGHALKCRFATENGSPP